MCVTSHGTAAYHDVHELPPLVHSAVGLARARDFPWSCLPSQGELLRLLARGAGPGKIGETGTGCGVGLAWLKAGAHPDARLVSIERDPDLAAAAAVLFSGSPKVDILTGDWRELQTHGPFDLLVLDGGGHGKKGDQPLEPAAWLQPGGILVIDDFDPLDGWPPHYAGHIDTARLHWLDHPVLRATQITIAPDHATIIAAYVGWPGAPVRLVDVPNNRDVQYETGGCRTQNSFPSASAVGGHEMPA